MDVKYMAWQINSLMSELSEAGWDVTVTQIGMVDGVHVRTTATKDGVTVESLYVHPLKGGGHGTA